MAESQPVHNIPFTTVPCQQEDAYQIIRQLAAPDATEIGTLLRVNPRIAQENRLRYFHFHDSDHAALPALMAYTGIVFKHIRPDDFAPDDWTYAQQHLHITSFLYGLLRPLDTIRSYRLEGDVKLPEHQGKTMFEYWQTRLTDGFIQRIKADDGILVNLASDEMKRLFDWTRITREAQVITPEFKVYKDGKPRTVVVYTKMCRGEMTRYLLKQRIHTPESIPSFEWEGFRYSTELSKTNRPVFVL